MTKQRVANGGGAVLWLGVILVTLKALGVIDLSWFWVLAPFWIGFAITLPILVVMLVIFVVGGLWEKYR